MRVRANPERGSWCPGLAVFCMLTLTACGGRSSLPEPVLPLTPTPDTPDARPPEVAPLEHVVPAPVVQRLENGLTVLSLERPGLPFVEVTLGLRAAQDHGVSGGLARFTAHLLSHADPALDSDVEEDLDVDRVSVSPRGTKFVVRAASDDLDPALESLSQITRWPELSSNAEGLARHELAAFRESRAATSYRLRAAAMAQLYGPDSPIARSGAIARDAEFSLQQAREFHAQRYHPESSVLSIVGALSPAEAKALAQRHLGQWRAAGPPQPSRPTFSDLPPSGALRAAVLNNAERQAAIVIVAMPCVPLSNPEGLALDFAAMLLAQSHTSRARTELRHQSGGSYSVHAQCAQTGQSGTFLITFDSAPAKVGDAVAALLAAAKQTGTAEIGSEELAAARGLLLASTLNTASSRANLSGALATLYLDGLPLDDLAVLPARIRAITAAEIRSAASKYLDGTRVGIAVYGPAHVIVPQLRALGAVTW